MSSQHRTGSRRAKISMVTGLAAAGALLLSGCSTEVERGFMPGARETTDNSERILDLWVHSWIAALAIGLIVWGLILWCLIAYRRRKDEVGFPRQISYHLPLEIFYTVIPIFMIMTLFYFTARDIEYIDARSDNPDVVVDVRAKQWAWDFNYVKEDRYEAGVQAHLTGKPGIEDTLTTLYLPVGKTVELQLNSRDVIHSFWVPAFMQKLDVIPGKTNYMSFTPQLEGTYAGKCAELCGEYHSEMLFNVKVVSQAEYDAYLQTLPTGQLGAEYDRNPNQNPTN